MKKGFKLFILFLLIFSLGFKKNNEPNNYYRVYLNKELLGTVKSKAELEKYIDKNGSYYKKKFGVNNIYAPKGLQIKKYITFDDKVDSVSSVYKKINKKSDFTVKGYVFSIKKVDSKDKVHIQKINVLKKNVFNDAVDTLIDTFIGEDKYKSYISGKQVKIESTGENIQSVYVDEDITIRESLIPVSEMIYTDYSDLAQFLLYGAERKESIYNVMAGDSIESVAFNNIM